MSLHSEVKKILLKPLEIDELSEDVKVYAKYRECGRLLNDKLLQYICNTQKLQNDLKLLGVLRSNEVNLSNENEESACYDFILYEKTMNNKSGIDMFLEKEEVAGDESKIIDAMKKSYTALYRTVETNEENSTIFLEDITTGERINLIDIGFSKTLHEERLVFTRIIKLGGINFTSGMALIFSGDHEMFLKRIVKKEMKKSTLDSDVQRFISYFHLSRKHGINVLPVQTTQ